VWNFFQAFEQRCIGRRFLAALRLAIAVQESRIGQCQMYSSLGGYLLVILPAYIVHERNRCLRSLVDRLPSEDGLITFLLEG
jgi:hypothetical protein